MQIYTDFQNMIFQVIFDFRFFRIFDGFKIYFLFSLFLFLCSLSLFLCSLSVPLLLSVPFLIHYDIYYIYIYINIQLHFTRQLLQLLQAFRDLQPFRFCSRSDGKAEPAQYFIISYIYITLCTIQPLYYMLSIMQF